MTIALVEQLTSEGLIGMKAAALVTGQKHSSTPTRWHLRGVKLAGGPVLRLEGIRSGGRLMTSRAAVLRFLEAQNPPPSGVIPTPVIAGFATTDQGQRRVGSAPGLLC